MTKRTVVLALGAAAVVLAVVLFQGHVSHEGPLQREAAKPEADTALDVSDSAPVAAKQLQADSAEPKEDLLAEIERLTEATVGFFRSGSAEEDLRGKAESWAAEQRKEYVGHWHSGEAAGLHHEFLVEVASGHESVSLENLAREEPEYLVREEREYLQVE